MSKYVWLLYITLLFYTFFKHLTKIIFLLNLLCKIALKMYGNVSNVYENVRGNEGESPLHTNMFAGFARFWNKLSIIMRK